MARILIISAWYRPFIHPRAHRWACIAEHLAEKGHEVHVVCSRRRDCPDESMLNGVHVHRTGFDSLKEVAYFLFRTKTGRGRVGAGISRPSLAARAAMWLYRFFWKKIYFPDDACLWYFPACRKVKTLLKSLQRFDAVVSVSLPFTGHLVGWAAKRQSTDIRWLADIGDPFTIQPKPPNNDFLYGRFSTYLERAVLEKADAVVVTNAGALRAYRERFGEVADKLKVVPPLWHAHPQAQGGGGHALENGAFFWLGFFGALYAPTRTPDAFLDLLQKTCAARPHLRGSLSAHFFGEIFPEFFEKLSREPYVVLHGLCSRSEAQAAMRQMNVLVNIGNTTDYQLPSKVVEYLATGKPVLHFSYVERDPFIDFWGNTPGLLTLRVRDGSISDDDISRWLTFLETKHPEPTAAERLERVHKFTVPVVAELYAGLLLLNTH
ncbi:MAG: glycosyltransferase [Saprospiraceae bacterium]